MSNDEEFVWRMTVKVLTGMLDDLVGACMDAEGKPKTPDKKDLMRARGYLPASSKHSLQPKPKEPE